MCVCARAHFGASGSLHCGRRGCGVFKIDVVQVLYPMIRKANPVNTNGKLAQMVQGVI